MRFIKNINLLLMLVVLFASCHDHDIDPIAEVISDQQSELMNSIEDLKMTESSMSGRISKTDLQKIMINDLGTSNFTPNEMRNYLREEIVESRFSNKTNRNYQRQLETNTIWCFVAIDNGTDILFEEQFGLRNETFQVLNEFIFPGQSFPPGTAIESSVFLAERQPDGVTFIYEGFCSLFEEVGSSERVCLQDTPIATGVAFWNGTTQVGECDARLFCFEP